MNKGVWKSSLSIRSLSKQQLSRTMASSLSNRMADALNERKKKGTLRRLPASSESSSTFDFSSNDYLGLAHNSIPSSTEPESGSFAASRGATGSRLLSGDAPHFHELEAKLAKLHGVPYSLLFNSGYDANLSVVSCLAADVVLYDASIHNSLHMGLRLWKTRGGQRSDASFAHNSVADLRARLQDYQEDTNSTVVVLVESVYSMDGDIAPLAEMLDVAQEYNAHVVVDEAHGWGVLGSPSGLGGLEGTMMKHPALAFAVYTFGKAAGAHGALVCCPTQIARDYLVNYAYPFIYSTALPHHSLTCIENAYDSLLSPSGETIRNHLRAMIAQFRQEMEPVLEQYGGSIRLVPSTTPIQALIVPGNEACSVLCGRVYQHSGIRLFPIKSPTVPISQERVRIVLHGHNTTEQVSCLVESLRESLEERNMSSRL